MASDCLQIESLLERRQMENIQLYKEIFTFNFEAEHEGDFFMRQSFAPNINQAHQKRVGEKIEIDYASSNRATNGQHYQQPQKISISFLAKDLSFDFHECDIGEVDVEYEAEVELAHIEQSSDRSPEIELKKCLVEGVKEQGWREHTKCTEKGDSYTSCEIGACGQWF